MPNNQRQHRTSHAPKDVLPLRICANYCVLFPQQDRNPAPLNELDSLLNLSYTRITEGAAKGEAAEALLKSCSPNFFFITRKPRVE